MNGIDKARRTAGWICSNQHIRNPDWPENDHPGFDMHEDMNYGRFVRNYSLTQRKVVHLSTNWLTGMALYALLSLNDVRPDEVLVMAALRGAWYLRSLQNTFEGNPEHLGALNERIPANRWCAPRDALSGAWGLLRLYRAVHEEELLKRAELFAAWHMRYAMSAGFPVGYYHFTGQPSPEYFAGCQAGSALFYADLFDLTGDRRYLETVVKLLDYYCRHFFFEDGAPAVIYNPSTGYRGERTSTPEWSDMHQFNDDFGMLALLAGHRLTGTAGYRETAERYMRWVVSRQDPEGGFGKYRLSVSSGVAALNLLNLFLVTGESAFRDAAFRALAHFEQSVIDAPGDPAIHGGVLGLEVARLAPNNDMLCLRASAYAVPVFLLFGLVEDLGRPCATAGLPDAVIANPLFPGLRAAADAREAPCTRT